MLFHGLPPFLWASAFPFPPRACSLQITACPSAPNTSSSPNRPSLILLWNSPERLSRNSVLDGRRGLPLTGNLPKNRTKTGLLVTGDEVEGLADGLRKTGSGKPLRRGQSVVFEADKRAQGLRTHAGAEITEVFVVPPELAKPFQQAPKNR